MRSILKTIVIAFVSGLAGAYVMFRAMGISSIENTDPGYTLASDSPAVYRPVISGHGEQTSLAPVDFSEASSRAIPSVVFVKSIAQGVSMSYWDFLFGEGSQTKISSGSGVIFSSDGYIVTNNHVVSEAERIEVQYNKKVYKADLIGTDPSTDVAVLKIREDGLPAITLGNSSTLQVGEWVIAVGNPFSLSSTVTAGIVSAKGRRIGILEDKFPIESFIQTDAAINPGNSGGALVNRNGELVGINTAILSKTGSYTGYAFAVPVDIVRKVVNDIVKYGIVQKALFGGSVLNYEYETAKKYDLKTDVKNFNGVLLERMDRTGPAASAGLKPGDIITAIDNHEVNSQSQFEEMLSYHYPGDHLSVRYERGGDSKKEVIVTLVNADGKTGLLKREILSSQTLGAQLEKSGYGVKVFGITDGYFKKLGMPENYTIMSINREKVTDPQEVVDFFESYKGRVSLYGVTASRGVLPFNFILR